jgi:ABC-type glycerol-3-phosphate transport system substrate-binding protein
VRATAAALVALALVAAGCGSSSAKQQGRILVVVDAPFSQSPYIGNTIANGARLTS